MNNKYKDVIEKLLGHKSELAESLNRDINTDIEKLNHDYNYSDTIIRTIVISSQELENLLKEFTVKNNIEVEFDIWNKTAGKLLCEIKKSEIFNENQINILYEIIELRNWVIHDILKEEKEYKKSHIISKGCLQIFNIVYDGSEWLDYYRTKLAITKNLLYEAVDLFNNASSILNEVRK